MDISNTKGFALLTGGTGAIGQAIARRLDAEGWNIGIAARDASKVAQSVEGTSWLPIVMDVTKEDEVVAGFEKASEAVGRIDLLVNAAGIRTRLSPLLRLSAGAWDEQHQLHSRGAFLTSRQAMALMRRQQSGMIVNIASIAAHRPVVPGYGGYAAAKASMVSLTKSINVEAGRYGIRATALCPTYVDTPLWEGANMPPDSMLHVDAIARSVLFLCQLPPGTLVEVLDLTVASRAP